MVLSLKLHKCILGRKISKSNDNGLCDIGWRFMAFSKNRRKGMWLALTLGGKVIYPFIYHSLLLNLKYFDVTIYLNLIHALNSNQV